MKPPCRSRWLASAAVLLVVSIVAAACGGEDDLSDRDRKVAATTSSTSTTTTVPIPVGQPMRIVSLSPSATESLFAIGAGPQVIAVDSKSNFPLEAPVSDLSAEDPDLEAIAKLEPDLVVTDGTDEDLVRELNEMGIPTVTDPPPKTLAAAFEQIERLGATTGNIAPAAELVSDLEQRVLAIRRNLPDRDGVLGYYYELDDSFLSLTSKTFIGNVLSTLEMESIADPADDSKSAGFPQLAPEFIVEADPDVIILADTKCCGQSAQTVSERAGWEFIRGVRDGYVIELDEDMASRWGPRIVDLLEQIAATTSLILLPPVEG